MTTSPETKCKSQRAAKATLAKALAPEEIRSGDFVTPLYVIAEVPSYWWCAESWNQPLDEPVRIRFKRHQKARRSKCARCACRSYW